MQGPWVATQDGAQWFIGAPVSDTLPAHAARHIGNAYNEANARLIAAAPDMLAALHEVLNLCDRDSEIGWVCVAAIAKAKGN
jgi:hypothetical protein